MCDGAWDVACGMNTLYGLLRSRWRDMKRGCYERLMGPQSSRLCTVGEVLLNKVIITQHQNPTCKEKLMVAWSLACISAEIQL